jgi:FkbM family methyltransferase
MENLKKVAKKIPFVASTYRNARDKWMANKKAVVTPFGFKFIGNKAMQLGHFESEDVKIFQKLMEDVDTVVDAGAHAGYYCLQALSFHKHLIAFEPMPLNAKMLLDNITINGWEDNAEVFPIALAEKPGIAKMYGGGTGASLTKGWAGFSPKDPILVPVSSLDTVLNDRLAGSRILVLIDVEGAEYPLLNGAKKLLASDPKPVWMVEIVLLVHQPEGRKENPQFISTFELFWEHGYDAYISMGGKVKLLDEKFIRADAEAATKGTSSNFIFVHGSSHKIRKELLDLVL